MKRLISARFSVPPDTKPAEITPIFLHRIKTLTLRAWPLGEWRFSVTDIHSIDTDCLQALPTLDTCASLSFTGHFLYAKTRSGNVTTIAAD